MLARTLVFLIAFFLCNSFTLAESNKLPVNCLKAFLILLGDVEHKERSTGHQPDLRLYVEKSVHQSICGINESKANEVYLLFSLKYIDKEGRELVARPSYLIDIEGRELVARPSYLIDIELKKVLEFKGRG